VLLPNIVITHPDLTSNYIHIHSKKNPQTKYSGHTSLLLFLTRKIKKFQFLESSSTSSSESICSTSTSRLSSGSVSFGWKKNENCEFYFLLNKQKNCKFYFLLNKQTKKNQEFYVCLFAKGNLERQFVRKPLDQT